MRDGLPQEHCDVDRHAFSGHPSSAEAAKEATTTEAVEVAEEVQKDVAEKVVAHVMEAVQQQVTEAVQDQGGQAEQTHAETSVDEKKEVL